MSAMEGHGEPCYYCREACDATAGNPGRWPIPLCHPDEPGVVKWHHVGCVSRRLVGDSVERISELEVERNRLDGLLRDEVAKNDAVAARVIMCAHCGARPAACFGVHEDSSRPIEPACDECCGHGDEDGWCRPIQSVVEQLQRERERADRAVDRLDESARREAELWDAIGATPKDGHAGLVYCIRHAREVLEEKIAMALVAAAYEVAAKVGGYDAEYVASRILALTPADAREGLDRLVSEAEERGWRKRRDALAASLSDKETIEVSLPTLARMQREIDESRAQIERAHAAGVADERERCVRIAKTYARHPIDQDPCVVRILAGKP